MKVLLIIGLGGFLGTIGRYLMVKWIHSRILLFFPYGTMTVNILGSLLIGIILGLSFKSMIISNELKLFLAVGFCGGFTTFSSFSNDGLTLIREGQVLSFLLYTGISVIAGLMAVYAGYLITKLI